MAGSISWKEFEAIVARLQSNFATGGKVTSDDKILGRNSGKKRQIDISVRANVGGEEILIIVECKKWNRKPDVKAVEAFAGVKEDVGAHLGIMVSTKGFTDAARRTASAKGISLYRYEDTLKLGWPNGLETKFLIEVWNLTPKFAYFTLKSGIEEPIVSDDDLDFIDSNTGEMGPIATLTRKLWDTLNIAEKYDRSWAIAVALNCPERPEIASITIGAESKLIRGYRLGKLQFEGLIDDAKGYAKVNGWKMIFAGDFVPLPAKEYGPHAPSYSLLARTTHVKTQDPQSAVLLKLFNQGIVQLEIKKPGVFKLPIRSPLSH